MQDYQYRCRPFALLCEVHPNPSHRWTPDRWKTRIDGGGGGIGGCLPCFFPSFSRAFAIAIVIAIAIACLALTQGSVDLEKIDDPRERAALESQISEFGQCPSLLFRGPHPCRDAPVAPILVAPPFGKQRHLGSRMRKLPGGRSGKGVDGGSRGSEGGGDVAVMTAPPGGDQMATSTYASGGGGAGGGADVVPCQPPGQAWQGMMGASQSRRRSESTSPYSPPSSPAGLMGGGLTVGSSVGALWKRGLAMAGVVSATAEPAGARGGFNTLQERQGVGARDPLGGVEADREVLGQHVVGSDGLTHTSSLPPPPSAPVRQTDCQTDRQNS